MNLHLPHRARAELEDRKLIRWVSYLTELRDTHHARLEQRALSWPPDLPPGGKTR